MITAAFPVAVLRSVWREAPPLLTAIGGCPPSAKVRAVGEGHPVRIRAERSDEELAAADIGGNLIVVIQCPVWSRARTAGLEHAVLVAADDGGLEAVNALISEAISGEACLAPTLSGCTIE